MRPTALVALLATLALGASACAGGSSAESDGDGAPRSAQVDGDPTTWPLTGLEVTGGGDAETRRPVLVLKMDNTASSAPQRGLSSADLVVEELVEGGVTRLAVFYDSDIPGDVGPVRSMRASDIGIVSPVGATVVTSGAAEPTIARLARADVPFVTEGSAGFFREPSRSAPYDLMADLTEVADALTGSRTGAATRPPDYLPFGAADGLPGGEPASEIAVRFSPAHTTTWRYERRRYVDTGSLAAPGDEFPADSVLVLRVRVTDAGYRDPAGNPVPETRLVGDGEAQLFHGGRVIEGRWTKGSLASPLALSRTTEDGDVVALPVPPGRTWIELVPLAGGVDVRP